MAEKKYFPLLPKLIEDAAVNPARANLWEDETADFLNALIKSLAAGASIRDVGHIDSIPDVWARPLLFQMALYDDGGREKGVQAFVRDLHERAVGEWRSLLAMIALKDVKNLDFSAEVVKIGTTGSGFEQVLTALSPQETLRSDTGWSEIYVLLFQKIPIAMTSPTTLVSAAADYQSAFGGRLPEPWSRDGYTLTDPIPCLTADDLTALLSWVKKIYQGLRDGIPRDEQERSEACQGILAALDDYRGDIESALQRSGQSLGRELPVETSNLGLNLGIYRLLNVSVRPQGAKAEDSAVRLILSQERSIGKTQEILLVSPEMVREFAEQEGVPATQLVVWQGLSANDVTEDALGEERGRLGRITLKGAVYRRPEEFFTEKMAVMEPGNAIIGSRPIAGMQMLAGDDLSAILPIKKELLEYFTPREIAERLTIENGYEDISVQFAFPLSGTGEKGSVYKFTKRYPKKELVFIQTRVPVIELWPNVRRDGWKKYYLYYENIEAQNESAQEAGKDFFYVYPWTYGKEIVDDLPEHGMVNRFTAKLADFPEALFCTVNVSDAGGVYARPVEVGVVLPDAPQPVKRITEQTWKIGIDFGTSSTMVYYRENRSPDAKPLSFTPNLFQITDSGAVRNNTFIDFLPTSYRMSDGSFLSIFHLLDVEDLHKEIRPVQDGHVFWLTTDRDRTEEFCNRANQIDTNLKWQDDDIGRRKVAAYVKQICLQAAAEAACQGVDKIQWNFSFPTAFSREQQFQFRAACEEAVREMSEGTCFERSAQEEIGSWPESKASAYHFNKLGGSETNFSEGAICLDIGAGTTDISVISGQPGRIVYHTSIQFAGRYLFAPIYRHIDLFAKEPMTLSGIDKEQQRALLDADLREHSEDYLRDLKNKTGQPEVKEVLQQAQLAAAGIFHYLGRLLAKLHETGVYTENHVPDIFVGGNGSRIFTWLTGGSFHTDNPYLDILKDIIVGASGLEEGYHFRIHMSGSPKTEVASGMIEERPHNDEEFFDEKRQAESLFGRGADEYVSSSMLAGETYQKDGESQPKESFISAYDISKGLTVETMDETKAFLDAFNHNSHKWSDEVVISEDGWRTIQRQVNGYYVSEKGKEIKKIFVEPVFIVSMKKMLEVLENG